MASVTTLPKLHKSFEENPSVKVMLKAGFTLERVLEVHGEFFVRLGAECPDEAALIGDHVSEARAQEMFDDLIKEQMENMTEAEFEEMQSRRLEYSVGPSVA